MASGKSSKGDSSQPCLLMGRRFSVKARKSDLTLHPCDLSFFFTAQGLQKEDFSISTGARCEDES